MSLRQGPLLLAFALASFACGEDGAASLPKELASDQTPVIADNELMLYHSSEAAPESPGLYVTSLGVADLSTGWVHNGASGGSSQIGYVSAWGDTWLVTSADAVSWKGPTLHTRASIVPPGMGAGAYSAVAVILADGNAAIVSTEGGLVLNQDGQVVLEASERSWSSAPQVIACADGGVAMLTFDGLALGKLDAQLEEVWLSEPLVEPLENLIEARPGLLVAGTASVHTRVLGFDGETGDMLWEVDGFPTSFPKHLRAWPEGDILVAAGEELVKISPDGQTLASTNDEVATGAPTLDEQGKVWAGCGFGVCRWNAQLGNFQQWSAEELDNTRYAHEIVNQAVLPWEGHLFIPAGRLVRVDAPVNGKPTLASYGWPGPNGLRNHGRYGAWL